MKLNGDSAEAQALADDFHKLVVEVAKLPRIGPVDLEGGSVGQVLDKLRSDLERAVTDEAFSVFALGAAALCIRLGYLVVEAETGEYHDIQPVEVAERLTSVNVKFDADWGRYKAI
ncbi:MAG: hypothetical protein ABSG36_18655 [Acidimicrobiales bacterium]|jgi:hypothetical protein